MVSCGYDRSVFTFVGYWVTAACKTTSYTRQKFSTATTEWTALSVISEFLICTTDGFYDGKTSNVASSPQRLSGPLRVVELGGPTDDKADACTQDSKCHSTVLDLSVVQIESSMIGLSRPKNITAPTKHYPRWITAIKALICFYHKQRNKSYVMFTKYWLVKLKKMLYILCVTGKSSICTPSKIILSGIKHNET